MNESTVFALGFFDGVHLGHAALLHACKALSRELGCASGVVTFENHPDGLVLGAVPGLINTVADRERMLRQGFGIRRVISLPFDRKLMRCPWQNFFHRLVEEFGAAGLVCGEDFRFGARGEGDAAKLQAACEASGLPLRVIPQLRSGEQVISSSRIRQEIELGRMEEAVQLLGHPHVLTGTVIHGHQLGRTLGIPTANMMLPKELVVPRFGVYACRCRIDGRDYHAVTNVGTRPTVAGIGITVEAWILVYEGVVYGRELSFEFLKFLRTEKRFASLEALRAEILRNAQQTREFFREN